MFTLYEIDSKGSVDVATFDNLEDCVWYAMRWAYPNPYPTEVGKRVAYRLSPYDNYNYLEIKEE